MLWFVPRQLIQGALAVGMSSIFVSIKNQCWDRAGDG